MPKLNPEEYLNPKKTMRRREAEAGMADPAASAPSTGGTSKFTKAFTPEDKKRQAGKLVEMLRNR